VIDEALDGLGQGADAGEGASRMARRLRIENQVSTGCASLELVGVK
jgi:hypothetical protein